MDSPRDTAEATTDPPKTTPTTLLLCYIHGFKGSTTTFGTFPTDLESHLTTLLPTTPIKTLIYPQYSTVGELHVATRSFLDWLNSQITTLTPNNEPISVILIAHSMGGFVASDALFLTLPSTQIRAILSFDTPYNGLARPMFVYGAFSNYQRVTSVFNVMTALSAAAPAALSKITAKRTLRTATKGSTAWKTWQIIAVRTGTVGAIAAGGVAAYVHRKQIMEGVKGLKGVTKEDVRDRMGQGLAYVNRGSVGGALSWLSEHFAFVGSLLRQNEMERRLERLERLRGVGIRDYYVSLGENGVWSGGYFVPERTFCAVPGEGKDGKGDGDEKEKGEGKRKEIFKRWVVEADDEVVAHVSMFNKEGNKRYEDMVKDAAVWVKGWAESEEQVWDDPKFQEPVPPEEGETEEIAKVVDGEETAEAVEEKVKEKGVGHVDDVVPDESPIDIAAAASLVPLPEDDVDIKDDEKKAYLRHLFSIAQSTGSGLWGNIPSKMPTVDMSKVSMPSVSMPSVSMPTMPSIPSMPSVSMPKSFGLFSKKSDASVETKPSSETDTGVAPDDKVDNKAAAGEQTIDVAVNGKE